MLLTVCQEPVYAPGMTSSPVRRGGRPAQISRQKILEAAAELPVDDVTMSAVAARLGVTHASLYKYFPSRAALVAAVLMDLGERIEVPDPATTSWQEWVVAAGLRCRDHMVVHLGATGLLRSSGLDAALGTLLHSFVDVLAAAGFSSLATWDAWVMFRGCCLGGAMDARRIAALNADPTLQHVWGEVLATFSETAKPSTLRFIAEIAPAVDLDTAFRRQMLALVSGWSVELLSEAGGERRPQRPLP